MRLYIQVLASLQVILEFFFFTFPNKWVGRAMGNEALNWDGLQLKKKFYCKNGILFIHVPRTFLLENSRGGKALRMRLNPDSV